MPQPYRAPIEDLGFALGTVADIEGLAGLPGLEEATGDLVEAVLGEAGRLAAEVLAPLNQTGDEAGSHFQNGVVRTPHGFVEAYQTFVQGGWQGLPFAPEHGGQGLPWALALSVMETWNAANLSWGLCPLLTQGAAEVLEVAGSPELQETYLPKLVSGEWSGTMNLTEPQAGSDVGAAKTRAVLEDGRWRITGQKIYITHGEQDMSENIVHLVLARTPGAPPGTKGISLFLVPKFLPGENGALGPRNDLRCVSLEHKLGIKASPTAVMSFGDDGGAEGWLIGEENQGMSLMFLMMNNARLSVAVQGVGIAERAYQQARAYAAERRQGRRVGSRDPESVAIVEHPDVRRQLLTMRATTEAGRALCLYTAAQIDRAKREPDETARERAQKRLDLLTPVCKGWCTDQAVEVASIGVQVHGGMGFIEETGAAQHYRDARILPIYEGTNGIQGLDLVMRKVARDEGAAARALLEDVAATQAALAAGDAAERRLAAALEEGAEALERATRQVLGALDKDPALAAGAATPYLRLFGFVAAGWLLFEEVRGLADQTTTPDFAAGKRAVARFYAENLLPAALLEARRIGSEGLFELTAEAI